MQTLAWARKHGFKPVALHYHTKAAINGKFKDPNYQPPHDGFWQTGNFGVGIATGPQANGPIDVDLDSKEAVYFAPRFLPSTPAIFGRAGKPRSHYLYIVNDFETTRQFRDPVDKENQSIVEMRSNGSQTVFPGSIHEKTGEIVEWSETPFPDVPTIDLAILHESCCNIAICTLIARHIYHEGSRNEVTKMLAGTFWQMGWPEPRAAAVIQAVMDYTGDDDKTRMLAVASTYRKAEKGQKVTGARSLRKHLGDDKVVDRILELAGSEAVSVIADYNERFAVCVLGGKFRIADTDVVPSEPITFFQKEDFVNFMGADWIEIDGKMKPKPIVWLGNPRRRTYRHVGFFPGEPVDVGNETLNLWTGWRVQPEEGDCSGWLELLALLCGDDASLIDWLTQWYANIVQSPLEKPLTAPVFIGLQGAGKSLLNSYFGEGILGGAYQMLTNEEQIHGKFNNHLSTCLLLHSEEALYAGDRKHRGIVKSMITDGSVMHERKGIDAEKIRSYMRLVLVSNEEHAAPVETGDRRYTIIHSGRSKVSEALIKKVLKEKRFQGPAALLHHLQNKVTVDFNRIRVNVKNDALVSQKLINADPIDKWWHEVLDSETLLPDYLQWASKPTDQRWPTVVGSPALYASFVVWMKDRNIRSIISEVQFYHHLTKIVGRSLAKSQRQYTNTMSEAPGIPQMARTLNERQQSITNLPTLAECRAAFEAHIGQPIEWAEPMPDSEKPPHERF